MDKKKIVVPGDILGTEEEYLPGPGTISQDGKIYATLIGEVKDEKRTLSVLQKGKLTPFDVGTVVIGCIENIVEPIALVRLKPGSIDEDQRVGDNPDYAVLHASMIKKGYVRNVRDEYKIGDIIRAKIVDIRNGEMRLSTEGDEMGAIKAFCAKCRHPMEKTKDALLRCESCGAKDNRKIAKDYRNAVID